MTEFSKNGTNKSNKIVPFNRDIALNHNLEFNSIAPPADEKAQARLTFFGEIKLNEPIQLLIKIEDFEGNAIEQFDPVRERLMHLEIVSNDLYVFDVLYPAYRTNGCFAVEANFSKPDSYTLFSCYKPSGQQEMISNLKVTVPGPVLSPPEISLNHTQVVGNTEIQLRFPQSTVDVWFSLINIRNAEFGLPIKRMRCPSKTCFCSVMQDSTNSNDDPLKSLPKLPVLMS